MFTISIINLFALQRAPLPNETEELIEHQESMSISLEPILQFKKRIAVILESIHYQVRISTKNQNNYHYRMSMLGLYPMWLFMLLLLDALNLYTTSLDFGCLSI